MNPYAWSAIGQGASAYVEARRRLEEQKEKKAQQAQENADRAEQLRLQSEAGLRAGQVLAMQEQEAKSAEEAPQRDQYWKAMNDALAAQSAGDQPKIDAALARAAHYYAGLSPESKKQVGALIPEMSALPRTPEQSLGLLAQGAAAYKAGVEEEAIVPYLRAGGIQLPEVQAEPYVPQPTPLLAQPPPLGVARPTPPGAPTLTMPPGPPSPAPMRRPKIFGPPPANEAQILANAAKERAEQDKALTRQMTEWRLEGNDLRDDIKEVYERNPKTADADTEADRTRLYVIVRYYLPLRDPDAVIDWEKVKNAVRGGFGRKGAMTAYQARSLDVLEGREARLGQAQSFDQALAIWQTLVTSGKFGYQQYRDAVRDAQWHAEQRYLRTQDAQKFQDDRAIIRYTIKADVKAARIDQETADDLLLGLEAAPVVDMSGLGSIEGAVPPGGKPPMAFFPPFEVPTGLPGQPGAKWRGDTATTRKQPRQAGQGALGKGAPMHEAVRAARRVKGSTDAQITDVLMRTFPGRFRTRAEYKKIVDTTR